MCFLALRVELGTLRRSEASWLRQVVSAGFDGVELAISAAAPDSPELLRQIACTGRVLALAARVVSRHPETALKELSGLMRLAREIGAEWLNLSVPGGEGRLSAGSPAPCEAGLHLCHELLHQGRFEAEREGVAIGVEPGAGSPLTSPMELRELIDDSPSWAIGACVDLHRVASFSAAKDWLETLGRRVFVIRVDVENYQSSGAVWLPAALRAIGFEGLLICRVSPDAAIIEPALLHQVAGKWRAVLAG